MGDKFLSGWKSYLDWLIDKTGPIGTNFEIMLETLHKIEYVPMVPNDDNRGVEGLTLREEFTAETGEVCPLESDCTLLEMMLALAVRINEVAYDYNDPDKSAYWFWAMIANLKLDQFPDVHVDPLAPNAIRMVALRVVNRTYRADGYGGLFPLKRPPNDQREVEIWYQMQYWLDENEPEYV